jgi:lipopolysaccharide export system protein LptC
MALGVSGPNFATQFRFTGVRPNRELMSPFQNHASAAGVATAHRGAPSSARASARRIAIAPPRDREQDFARAKRRSARVRILRAAILIGGLGSVAAMFGIAVFDRLSIKLGALTFNALSVEGTKVVMERPKLAGFRNDGQPYLLTAERALQDVKQPTIVELQRIDGEIGMAGGEATHLTADTGIYDSMREHMDLSNNVWIKNSRFDVSLRRASFDFKSGAYESDDPVEVHAGDGTTIFADRAAARNNGQELTFEGHVKTRIISQADQQPAADPKRTNP